MPTAIDPRIIRLLLATLAIVELLAIGAAVALEMTSHDAGRAWDLALMLGGALAGALTLRHQPESAATIEVPGVTFTEGGD